MRSTPQNSSAVFKPDSGASAFFTSILVWGIGVGCFTSVINNYLADIHSVSALQRGILEFFRELPGLMLVFMLALLSKRSDWRIMRLGVSVSMFAALLLLFPANFWLVTFFITLWSLGEHLVMPVRYSIAMHVANPNASGRSLGFLTSAMNAGNVCGSAVAAAIFWAGTSLLGAENKRFLYDAVFALIAILLAASVICSYTKSAPNIASDRPRLYFSKKFSKFYILELFYGARKQVFLTFAPYVLIIEYGFPTSRMALLMGICAAVNIFASPLIGKITDRFGYRNVMIYDTVILFFVCLFYGFASDLFPIEIAGWILCANYLCDAVISTTSMATNIYAREISSSRDELTSTLSSGISVNHLISITIAPLGGWIWTRFGIETLFSLAALMAALNSLFALSLPKPKLQR